MRVWRGTPVVNRSYSQNLWLREFHIKATYTVDIIIASRDIGKSGVIPVHTLVVFTEEGVQRFIVAALQPLLLEYVQEPRARRGGGRRSLALPLVQSYSLMICDSNSINLEAVDTLPSCLSCRTAKFSLLNFTVPSSLPSHNMTADPHLPTR